MGCWVGQSLKFKGVCWGPQNRSDVFAPHHSALSSLLRQLNAEAVLDIIMAGNGGHVANNTGPKIEERLIEKKRNAVIQVNPGPTLPGNFPIGSQAEGRENRLKRSRYET